MVHVRLGAVCWDVITTGAADWRVVRLAGHPVDLPGWMKGLSLSGVTATACVMGLVVLIMVHAFILKIDQIM